MRKSTENKETRREFISVVIPVYQDSAGLQDTLTSLKEQSVDQDAFEVIVANDTHDAGISAVCKEFGVVEVYSEDNLGAYGMRNLALENAIGEFVLFTDADIRVNSDWIKNYIALFKKGYDYIGGSVKIDSNKVQTLTNEYVELLEFESEDVYAQMHFSATANVGVRRTVFDQLGVFDARLFSAGDYELGDRVWRDGRFKMYFDAKNYVIHPPRDDSAYFKKLKRLAKGERDLNRFYPGRFEHLDVTAVQMLRNVLYIPPALMALGGLKRVQIIGLHLMYQFYRALWGVWYMR